MLSYRDLVTRMIKAVHRRESRDPILGRNGNKIGELQEFWGWYASDLLGNLLRGVFAEYLVGTALGCDLSGIRVEWDAYDLTTPEGLKIEVKSSGYLQSWSNNEPSTIRFDIAERRSGPRAADVYVFCVFTCIAVQDANPLDTRQWDFCVVTTERINAVLKNQKSIGLEPLKARLQLKPYRFEEISEAVKKLPG
ncbi:hypothetical protein J5O04_10695 [Corynebacterium hindlerae]|uniref:hypothetical protein n=1 Tax=Corynebacterium hindlerae TaxID=699041 RepID=UPI001AD6EDB7|nr:hypothetical protein [Corynebacterium hindlerae]QTH59259.1 hypothetical protein J5O04_10695 [Corynebacterium hindlerae]